MDGASQIGIAETGTGLDRLVDIILSDEGLAARIPEAEIRAGAAAAATMNAIIVEGIRALGLARSGEITAGDVRDLSDWVRTTRAAAFTEAHGNDENASETGFHLVQNDGGAVRLYGSAAVDTVADGIYHLVFGYRGANIVNEDGNANARLEDIAWWLNELLEEEIAAAGRGAGPLAGGPDPLAVATSGTGLDRLVDIVLADPALGRTIPTSELAEGAQAAADLNTLIAGVVQRLGLVNDGRFTTSDAYAVSETIRADAALNARFVALHGDDEDGSETGFHLVQGDGAQTRLFAQNAVDTVADGIYHIGFETKDGRFVNEDGAANASVRTVAGWIETLIEQDLEDGTLVNAGGSILPGGTTGTGLDRLVEIVEADIGLNDRISLFDIKGGAEAANALNALLLEAIEATGTANDGRLSTADMRDVNAWLRADAGRLAAFVKAHGDDADGIETGFHLVQNDGATTRLYGQNATDTVADGIYHFGFAIRDGRFLNEDGNANQTVADVAAWVDALLTDADFAALTNLDVMTVVAGTTGTGLDDLVAIIMADPRLEQRIATSEIVAGAVAADTLNGLLIRGIEATGAAADGHVSALDMVAINAWLGASGNFAAFAAAHGDDADGVETGFHTVQGDGSVTKLFGRNAIDTVMDGIYHFGFAIQNGRFLNEDGAANASVATVAGWINALLAEDIASGRFYDPAFDPARVDAAALEARLLRSVASVNPNGTAGHLELPDGPDLDLGAVTLMLAFTARDLDGRQGLFSRDGANFQDGGHTTLWTDGDDILLRVQTTTDEIHIRAADILKVGVETHVAVTLDGQTARLYVNGALAGERASTASWARADEDITIGASAAKQRNAADNSVEQVFNGQIEDVKVYAGALSATEIQAAGGVSPAAWASVAYAPAPVYPEGTTGTGLDRIVAVIATDPGLAAGTGDADIAAGALAADTMNGVIVQAIRATGVANDGRLTAADIRDLSDWIASDGRLPGAPGAPAGTVRAPFLAAHGDDDGAAETGFHRVQGDGGEVRLFGEKAINTVADGLYHLVFGYRDGKIINEDGNANATLEDLAFWASELLAGDLARAALGAGPLAGAGARFDIPATGTGLDRVTATIFADPGLERRVATADMIAGAEAAAKINGLMLDAIEALGLANDGDITASDVYAINAWIRADATRLATFVAAHGNDEGGVATGFHRVQNDGAVSRLFGQNEIDTVFDGLYHIGFEIAQGRLRNEDGAANASVETAAFWLEELLRDDLQAGTLATGPAVVTGTTGTGLDRLVAIVLDDGGLKQKISELDIRAGAAAADALNAMIIEAIVATGVATDGQIRTSDIHEINAWFRADAARLARFVALHGDDEDGVETGFHLVQNDGARTRLFDDNAVDTVADGLFHIGFGINRKDGRLTNEDGANNAALRTVAGWLDSLLTAADYAALAARSTVSPYVAGSTGTGLDALVNAITADDGLIERIPTSEIAGGAAAADALNAMILEGLTAIGATNDGSISSFDVMDLNAWFRADAARLARFVALHGNDEDGVETGFHLVQNDGARTHIFGKNLADTVADGIYHIGFEVRNGRFLNEDGAANASVATVAGWLNGLLAEDLARGGLDNPAFDPGKVDLGALAARRVFSFDETLAVTKAGGDREITDRPGFDLAAGTVIARFTAESPADGDMDTIFSRDGTGFQDGGHLTAFVQNSDLKVRMQSATGEIWLKADDAIVAGRAHVMAVTFDGAKVALFLDGAKVAEQAFDATWAAADEDLQIGANIWSQTSNASTKVTHRFHGTIDHLSVHAGALTVAEIQALAAALPATSPDPTPPPPPTAPGAPLLSFFVADTRSDRAVAPLADGAEIAASLLAGVPATIVAEPRPGVGGIGSVRLTFDGRTQTENVTPYALFGDRNGDYAGGVALAPGAYTLTVRAYSGANGSGTLLETQTIGFRVAADPAPVPVPAAPEPAPVPEPEAAPLPEPEAAPVPEPEAAPVPEPEAAPLPEPEPEPQQGLAPALLDLDEPGLPATGPDALELGEPEPDPAPAPGPVAPAAVPVPSLDLAALSGATVWTLPAPITVNAVGDAIEVADSPRFDLGEGTILLGFTADDPNDRDRDTVFSRDGIGRGDGGHVTAWVERGDFRVQFETEDRSVTLVAWNTVQKGVAHDAAIVFDGTTISLAFDGAVVASRAFNFTWERADEDIWIGASAAHQRTNADSRLIDPFEGTITEVTILATALTPEEIEAMAA